MPNRKCQTIADSNFDFKSVLADNFSSTNYDNLAVEVDSAENPSTENPTSAKIVVFVDNYHSDNNLEVGYKFSIGNLLQLSLEKHLIVVVDTCQ